MTFGSGLICRNDIWTDYREDDPKYRYVSWVEIILETYHGDPNQAYHLARQARIIERFRAMGLKMLFRVNISPWSKHRDTTNAWKPVLLGMTQPGEPIQLGNEPNHPGENFGGSSIEVAKAFNDYWTGLIDAFRRAIPDRLYGFPGLAVAQNDSQWMVACAEAIRAADFVGMHIYWQGNNAADPAWGRRYEMLAPLALGKDIYVTEYGDSTPGRSAVAKAEWYKVWLLGVQAVAKRWNIKAAFAFIASSPDPQWKEFEVTEEAARLLELPKEEETEEMDFSFGFKDMHDANPAVVGEATSPQIDIPDVASIQFTENGMLVFRSDAGVKFFEQGLPKVPSQS